MRLSVAIAARDAGPDAFVVWRGFEESIARAAALGYHGVELALRDPGQVDRGALRAGLDETGLAVSAISTGQVFAADGLSLTDPDHVVRARAAVVFGGLVKLAGEFGGLVNIGRARGFVGDTRPRAEAEDLFVAAARALCDTAAPFGVGVVVEPVNRYETDFLNDLDETADLIARVERDNIGLMPDTFHMNIEDARIGEALARHGSRVRYVHLADSNRRAPGQGHVDFAEVFDGLRRGGFDGWAAVEVLPVPDADTAARQAAEFLLPMVEEFNRGRG